MTKAESLFEQYRLECGMDEDDVKAARWYKAGLIEFADWLLQQKCEQCNVSGRSELLLAFLQYVDTIDLVKYDAMSHEDLIAGFEASNCH